MTDFFSILPIAFGVIAIVYDVYLLRKSKRGKNENDSR